MKIAIAQELEVSILREAREIVWKKGKISFPESLIFLDPDRFITKRIVALEGDLIQNEKSADFHGSIVPKGHCWVEGDNYQVSEDSIKYGPISTGLILAKITHIFGLWPTFPFIVKRLTPYRNPEVSAGGTVVITNHVQVSALR